MAKLTIDKQSYISTTTPNFVPKEEFVATITLIQKRIDQVAKVQKAKNWKNGLTK